MLRLLTFFGALLCLALSVQAQNENDPTPREGAVRITFLPPPLEGTLSLGIFKDGKLIRTLRSEASIEKDFTVGLNAISATWDGKDDHGAAVPPGRYKARGYCVGTLGLSGEAILGNDWYDGETLPPVAAILSLDGVRDEVLLLTVRLVDGATALLQCDRVGRLTKREVAVDGTAAPAQGKDGSLWTIDHGPDGPEVKQFSKDKEFVRRLALEANDPAPTQIAASPTEEVLYLLEEKPGEQRVRGLALDAASTEPARSTWKQFLSKRIVASPDYASIKGGFKNAPAFKPVEKLSIKLVPNPLEQDAASNLDLQIGFDEHGSFLRTADGLRLAGLSDTPFLRWVAFGHEGASKAVTLLQGDGAMVEEFRLRRANNIMAFDAGEYELKR